MSIPAIHIYQREIERIIDYGGSRNESSIRGPFAKLLNEYAIPKGLLLVAEISLKTPQGKTVIPDGTLKDALRQDWGYWESKDEYDDLDEEIRNKIGKGYPSENILFEDGRVAVLIRGKEEIARVPMSDAKALNELLQDFVNYERPEVQHFREAIENFKADVPMVASRLRELMERQAQRNRGFVKARDKFLRLCQKAINPDVTIDDVREMIIQHILTEDIFNTVFDETQFHRENNIAQELDLVTRTFFIGAIRRATLLSISRYYKAINAAAAGISDHHEKQRFLKVVYETFYRAYNPKSADRLGVVYTPNEIVKFMVASADTLLHKHFGKLLEDKEVHILDPATGTGTFITEIIDYIRKDKLEHKYKYEMHSNEVAILPYYISNLNIEYTYQQKMGVYAEYKNHCFQDTLDNMTFRLRGQQVDMFKPFTVENSKRKKAQNQKQISVIIGNPPYNANQASENDDNKNRGYPEVDARILETFVKYSNAQKTKAYDMYSRFCRWAFDRLEGNGIVAFVTNRSFIDSRSFDGFRKCVQDQFDFAYIVDTKSDVRANPKITGTTHNIFGIQTGVAIMFLVQKRKPEQKECQIHYVALEEETRREEKLAWFAEQEIDTISFERIRPNKVGNWLTDSAFADLLPLVEKDVKARKSNKAIFRLFCWGNS